MKDIQQPVQNWLDETDRLLEEQVKSGIGLINKIIEVAPIYKGKKIRSTLLFLLSGMNGSFHPRLAEIAASLEIFHLSSLIHDDVVDNSTLRRGKQTLHHNLGSDISVMWGDYLFIQAFNCINNLHVHALMSLILKSARLMVEGQLIEMENTCNVDLAPETYYDIIGRKTASLFAGVTHIPALLTDLPPQTQERYYRFGMDFGVIFQVSDDMLDIFSDQSGKDRFRDLKEGKITLPYILLLKNRERHPEIRHALSQKDGERLLPFFHQFDIKDAVSKEVGVYWTRALEFIHSFPDSVYKASMLQLLEFIACREY
ncbi:MAG: polyprenyl synthetase family protein [Candidatus Omnitrophota bacterium]